MFVVPPPNPRYLNLKNNFKIIKFNVFLTIVPRPVYWIAMPGLGSFVLLSIVLFVFHRFVIPDAFKNDCCIAFNSSICAWSESGEKIREFPWLSNCIWI